MLDSDKVRALLQRGMREGYGGACLVRIVLTSGYKMTAKVTVDCPPNTWAPGEIVVYTEARSNVREEHHVALAEVALLTIVQA